MPNEPTLQEAIEYYDKELKRLHSLNCLLDMSREIRYAEAERIKLWNAISKIHTPLGCFGLGFVLYL